MSAVERSECQNCGTIWDDEELREIADYWQRVAPGEPTPSGECPACGALCQPCIVLVPAESPPPPSPEEITAMAVEAAEKLTPQEREEFALDLFTRVLY